MEQSRLIIAIAVSFAIFFAWSLLFAPKPDENSTEIAQNDGTQAEAVMEQPTRQDSAPSSEQVTEPIKPGPSREQDTAKTITVDTALYRITLSEKGAAVIGMTLKEFKETIEKGSPLKELMPAALDNGSVLLSLSGGVNQDLTQTVFSLNNQETTNFSAMDRAVELVFLYRSPQGVLIEKSYRFVPYSYLIDMQVKISNNQDGPLNGSVGLSLRDILSADKKSFGFLGPSALVDDKLKQVALKKIDEADPIQGVVKFIGLEQDYFMSALVLHDPMDGKVVPSSEGKLVENQLIMDLNVLEPGDSKSYQFSLFMGPKHWSLLRSYNNELDRAIDFGWVDFLAKPCLWFMNYIHKFVPNYGIAIIILTLVTRLIFWPLTHRSYKSMSDMRKLQPLMKEIREKYKNDKARINQETMALYRTYKINPMSGCLPMIIQLPVFFALYRMLYQAIELRHAPFFGWIQDLSAPDRLFSFGFKIPFMEPPYGIPVMTIIMGATMLLQQKMTPTPGDPAQAKMMMLMPIVFMVIFINFSSGLVLYWMVGNIISITQQYFTQKKLA